MRYGHIPLEEFSVTASQITLVLCCLLLEIARKAGHTPLATFDKSLGKLAGAQQL